MPDNFSDSRFSDPLVCFSFLNKKKFFVCTFSVEGHDSSEDASACMELMVWKIKEDAKGKRWPLTIYSASFRSSSRPPAPQEFRSMRYGDVRKNLLSAGAQVFISPSTDRVVNPFKAIGAPEQCFLLFSRSSVGWNKYFCVYEECLQWRQILNISIEVQHGLADVVCWAARTDVIFLARLFSA